MNGYGNSDNDHQPLMWVRGHAIFAAHFVVLVFVASLLVTSLLMAINLGAVLNWLTYNSADVFKGQVWRLFTYGLVNPPGPGNIIFSFVIDMFMIAWFGRELEKFFGRRAFLYFYGGLYFLSPLLCTLLGLVWPMHLAGETGAFAIFIAFATLHPNAGMMFNLLAKWVALILVGIYALSALAYHDWMALISLAVTSGYAYAFVCYQQGRFAFPSLNFWSRKPKLKLLQDFKPTKTISLRVEMEDSMAEMDVLLDKIARSGMSSLTAKERAQLAKAREDMMQKKTERR